MKITKEIGTKKYYGIKIGVETSFLRLCFTCVK